MRTFSKFLVGLLLLQTNFSQISAAVKPPILVLKVLDADSRTPIEPLSQKIIELSTNVRKNDSFIYRIEIEAEGYNSYVSTVDIPWSLRGKKVNVTNLMLSKFSFKSNEKKGKQQTQKSNESAAISVSGVVRDKAGNPLPNVKVSCLNAENVVVLEQFTGTDGKYSFSGLPAGRYTVKAGSARDVVGKEIRITHFQEPPLSPSRAITNSGEIPGTSSGFPNPLSAEDIKIVSAFNGTLVLSFQKHDSLEGINLSVYLDGKRYFIAPSNELAETPTNNAFLSSEIILNNRNIRKADGSPLFLDGIPFNLLVSPFAGENRYLTNTVMLKGLMTKDTIPPPLPVLENLSIADGKVTLSWKQASAVPEPLAYRIYFRKDSDFQLWQEISQYSKESSLERSYPLLSVMKGMSNLYVVVTAIDLAGNESDFQPAEAIIEPGSSPELVADLVLENGTLPPVRFVSKTPQKSKVKPKPKAFDANAFVANGYTVPRGVKLQLRDRIFLMPAGSKVTVSPEASLSLENVRFVAKSNETWMGIVVKESAALSARNLLVSKAETGMSSERKSQLQLESARIQGCAVAFAANQSRIVWVSGTVDHNSKAGDASYSTLKFKDVQVVSNGKNMNFAYCSLEADGLSVQQNRSSFYFMKGQLILNRSSFVGNGGEGLLLDGAQASVRNSRFLRNLRNGILCESDANPRIMQSDFIGNGYYAIKNGGILVDCHVARNNRSDRVDTTPDNGSEDGRFFTFSNQVIQQIFAADSLRGLKSIPQFPQEVAR